MSETIKNMMEDTDPSQMIPLPNVTGSVLTKVIEYCKYKVASKGPKEGEKADPKSDDEVKNWENDFVKVDQGTLFQLILAANYLNIKELLDLTCYTVANMIRGKSPEEIRKAFNIKVSVDHAVRRVRCVAFSVGFNRRRADSTNSKERLHPGGRGGSAQGAPVGVRLKSVRGSVEMLVKQTKWEKENKSIFPSPFRIPNQSLFKNPNEALFPTPPARILSGSSSSAAPCHRSAPSAPSPCDAGRTVSAPFTRPQQHREREDSGGKGSCLTSPESPLT